MTDVPIDIDGEENLRTAEDLDDELRGWLRAAYDRA